MDDKIKDLVNEEVFSSITNTTAAAIFLHCGKFIYINPAIERVTGYTLEEAQNMNVWDIVHPDMKDLIKQRAYDRIEGKKPPSRYKTKIISKNKKEIWIDVTLDMIKYKGQPAILGTAVDISELMSTQEALKQSIAKLKRILGEIVGTLSSIIESRDPYTAGHQHRVSKLASAIATEMNLGGERSVGIGIASLIHDIGKVSVPAEILSKPGKLSDAEFSMIKIHPVVGHDALEMIEFPWPIAQIILQHHERLDGSGYPAGLKSEEILLEAKILAVADVVEAISTHRPYRPALGIDKALEEIEKNKGILYDSSIVEACIMLARKKGFQLDA
jgi:PAS domain S-box-containing protein